ncbi:MAG TPA: OadG family transporter subunit [Synergistales bacterium]|nr:OadG family transporter subunit [Synergistales bacterium]
MQSMASHFAEGVGGALSLAFIAFSTVFLVLGGLTLIIMGVKYLSVIVERKPTVKPPVPPRPKSGGGPAPVVSAQGAAAPVSGQDQKKVIAAIAGALLACGEGARIKSIRPLTAQTASGGSLWKQAALMEGLRKLDRGHWKK